MNRLPLTSARHQKMRYPPRSATATDQMQFQAFKSKPVYDAYSVEGNGCLSYVDNVFDCALEQQQQLSEDKNEVSVDNCRGASSCSLVQYQGMLDPGGFPVTALNNGSSSDTVDNKHVGLLVSSKDDLSFHKNMDLWFHSEQQYIVLREGVSNAGMIATPPAKPPGIYDSVNITLQCVLFKWAKAGNSSLDRCLYYLLHWKNWPSTAYCQVAYMSTLEASKLAANSSCLPTVVKWLSSEPIWQLLCYSSMFSSLEAINFPMSKSTATRVRMILDESRCPVLANLQNHLLSSVRCIRDPGIGTSSVMYRWLLSLTAGTANENPFSWIRISELVAWQNHFLVRSTFFLWDPGQLILQKYFKLQWLSNAWSAAMLNTSTGQSSRKPLFSMELKYDMQVVPSSHMSKLDREQLAKEQKEMVIFIRELCISRFNAMHYCKIFQKYNTWISHLYSLPVQDFKYYGIALWLINFEPP